MVARLRSADGQAAVEYVAAALLVAALLGGMLTLGGLAGPAGGVARAIVERLVCAVRLDGDCRPASEPLRRAYGAELATLVRANAPEIRFEDAEFVSLPVDPRHCRRRQCADSSARGRLGRSFEDVPATAFVHVVDCRPAAAPCPGERRGRVYIQYWLYYPDSATRPWGGRGYHHDDWESFQVRLEPDGGALARASSHHGYNHGADPISDIGKVEVGPLAVDTRKPAWGPSEGFVWVSAGSHAGRVAAGDRYFRSVPPEQLRLVPLELAARSFERLHFEIAPPWLKQVWRDPEHTGT